MSKEDEESENEESEDKKVGCIKNRKKSTNDEKDENNQSDS